MEPKSFGRDSVISTTQLVQYDDDEENEDKLDSVHRAPPREGIDLGGGAQAAGAHLGGLQHVTAGMGVPHLDLSHPLGGIDLGLGIGRGAEGGEQPGHMVLPGGEVSAALAPDEAMRVYYSSSEVAQVQITPLASHAPGEYGQEELQQRSIDAVAEEGPVNQGGYLQEAVLEVASSFSESQQTQLRAQILIYGDLIKGVLPEHNLMLSAFQDGPEGLLIVRYPSHSFKEADVVSVG
ncbi:hypothetical protein R1sor_004623 [Riccia sorocarpa]|uniref:QLQ domain-containing protein n=1 Tax=Riccia sorocarpa TaxID=122646 RepID=A0ABD3HKQ5_9MARC